MKIKTARRLVAAAALVIVASTSATAAPERPMPKPKSVLPESRLQPADPAIGTDDIRYIVVFREPPLALYDGNEPGYERSPRVSHHGRNKLDTSSAAAKAYVHHLRTLQDNRIAAIGKKLGRAVAPLWRAQHALNAVVLALKPAEVSSLATVDGVVRVTADQKHSLSTDVGPGFIGASTTWWGAPAGQDSLFADAFESSQRTLGAGIVVGILDSGYNSSSPSFAEVDGFGRHIDNPLGQDVYLGECGVEGIAKSVCNDKVIGVYDFFSDIIGMPHSVEDVNGHGSHVASIAAGNRRGISGYSGNIAGVAPLANLVIYRVCDDNGTCFFSSIAMAIDQAVKDAVVDVLNLSITGGTDPWTDPLSQALLAASESGIFVAAAAGNGNPEPGSVNHVEPWVATVAAGTHTGSARTHWITVSGDGAPEPWYLQPGYFTPQLQDPIDAAIKPSPGYGNPGDGCDAYPDGTFSGAAALIKIGAPCSDTTMAGNALAAGAAFVIFVNSNDSYYVSGAEQAPVFSTYAGYGDDLAQYAGAHPGTHVHIGLPFRLPQQADALAYFSLLGPGTFDVIKPDLQAPGIDILAVVSDDGSLNGPARFDFLSGTSMASPTVAGAGALLQAIHPGWTPAEVKSALMMTARTAGLTKPDFQTPSNPFDRGSGRLQVDHAARAGLVLDESGINFLAADPAIGGDSSSLNLAGMMKAACIEITGPSNSVPTCKFSRRFRSTQNHAVEWTPSITGLTAANPAKFTIAAHDKRSINVVIDASSYPSDGTYRFGELLLTPNDSALESLRLPIAVRVPPPTLSAPQIIDIHFQGSSGSKIIDVANSGGPVLHVDSDAMNDGMLHETNLLDQRESMPGFWNLDGLFATVQNTGSYAAEDFHVPSPGANLSLLLARGTAGPFVDTNVEPPAFYFNIFHLEDLAGQKIHFAIYADSDGKPAGAPESGPVPNNPPVWVFETTIGQTPGLNVSDDVITLDLQAAAAPPTNLDAGRYWLVVYVDRDVYTQGSWGWNTSTKKGDGPAQFAPLRGATEWSADAFVFEALGIQGMQTQIAHRILCGAPWLSTEPETLDLDGLIGSAMTVNVDKNLFPQNKSSVSGYLCLKSNDPATPLHVIAVTATQDP